MSDGDTLRVPGVKEKLKSTYSTIVLVCRAIEAQHQVTGHLVEGNGDGV